MHGHGRSCPAHPADAVSREISDALINPCPFERSDSEVEKSLTSFDPIAPRYCALETLAFGNALQSARVAFLSEIGDTRRALIAGEGNGRFLEALLRRHPTIRVDCVDASARMLQLAKARVHDDPRVRFLHEDLKVWSPEEKCLRPDRHAFFSRLLRRGGNRADCHETGAGRYCRCRLVAFRFLNSAKWSCESSCANLAQRHVSILSPNDPDQRP